MPSNAEVAEQFEEIADRLLLEGESWFKIGAYRRAAGTIRSLDEPISELAKRRRLRSLPGVGDAITAKIQSFLETGHIPLLDRLRSGQPPGLLPLMREYELAPRDARALASSPLGIDSPQALQAALTAGSLEQSGLLNHKELERLKRTHPREAVAVPSTVSPDIPQNQSSTPASHRPRQ